MFLNARCIFSHTILAIKRKVSVLVFAVHMPVHVRACMSACVSACAWMCPCRVCWPDDAGYNDPSGEEKARLHSWAHPDWGDLYGGSGARARGTHRHAGHIWTLLILFCNFLFWLHVSVFALGAQVFYKPMSESGRLTEAEMAVIFVNWRELIMCNSKLLK